MTKHVGAQNNRVGQLQAQLNSYIRANHLAVPGLARGAKLKVDGKLGQHTRDALAVVRSHQKHHNQALVGTRGATPATRQAGVRTPRGGGADPKRQRVPTEARRPRSERPERAEEAAPVRRARSGPFNFGSLDAASPNHGIRHITQPDSGSCKPTTTRMIQNAGGHIGRERVGPGENMRLSADTQQRLLTQLQTTGVMAGVRSRSPNGAIRGSENGHVICISGYKIVDRSGKPVSDAAAREALSGANWGTMNAALAEKGLHVRLLTKDPGTSGEGAESYLDVGRDGKMSRPALHGGRVSQGAYSVRYLMLD